MSQTPFSQEARFPTGQLDIGPGGIIIADSLNNRDVLALIEKAPALPPIELYTLAVSYQQTTSNSGLGNHLAFIGLSNIFQQFQQSIPELFQQRDDIGIQVNPNLNSIRIDPCDACCAIFSPRWCRNCHCNRSTLLSTVKSINYAGLELLIEVTQVEESKTYVLLGVGPTHLEER